MDKKTYVIVGSGARSAMFYRAIATDFKETASLLALCDVNQTRMDYANRQLVQQLNHPAVPTYKAHEFEEMLRREKPDRVIVTTIDRTHHHYIVKALEWGCDVITEKPMTIDEEKCQLILDAVRRSGRELRVAFNYRYAPHNTKIRELLMNGAIGDVHAVHFEWLLNTQHGADYFHRWHRDKRNSGGLLVHKSTHHFDLVNFWLGSTPQTVYAQGDLMFYGRENAEKRGETQFYYRGTGSANAKNDFFALDLSTNERLKAMYMDGEHEDGYVRDQSVFGDGISIEDTMAVMVKYRNKAVMTYSLAAYTPWEGFNIAFTGSKGRLEVKAVERPYINAGGNPDDEGSLRFKEIVVHPLHAAPYKVEFEEGVGGHGGGDRVMLRDLFFGASEGDRFKRAASHIDGAMSILTGIAANRSIKTGLPVNVNELVRFE